MHQLKLNGGLTQHNAWDGSQGGGKLLQISRCVYSMHAPFFRRFMGGESFALLKDAAVQATEVERRMAWD
eukprot:10715391-Karenia_brevis.AAC.1